MILWKSLSRHSQIRETKITSSVVGDGPLWHIGEFIKFFISLSSQNYLNSSLFFGQQFMPPPKKTLSGHIISSLSAIWLQCVRKTQIGVCKCKRSPFVTCFCELLSIRSRPCWFRTARNGDGLCQCVCIQEDLHWRRNNLKSIYRNHRHWIMHRERSSPVWIH